MARRVSLAGPQSDVQGRMLTSTTGTGTLTLGAAAPGATTFANMPVPIVDGDQVTYELIDIGVVPVGKEKGVGTYHSAGPTLSRDTILWSTGGGAPLNLSGNAYVFESADDSDFLLVSSARKLLTAPTSFYYKPSTGSDSNPGTSSSPWASPAPLFSQYDFGGQAVTLNLQESPAGNASGSVISAWTGGGSLTFDGGGFTLNPNAGNGLKTVGDLPGPLILQNVTLRTSETRQDTFFAALNHTAQSQVQINGTVTLGASPNQIQIFMNGGGSIQMQSGSKLLIAGSAAQFMNITYGFFDGETFSNTIDLSGGPTFNNWLIVTGASMCRFTATAFPTTGQGFPTGLVNFNASVKYNGKVLPGSPGSIPPSQQFNGGVAA